MTRLSIVFKFLTIISLINCIRSTFVCERREVEKFNVDFYLSTNTSRKSAQVTSDNVQSRKDLNLNEKIVVVIHGFLNDHEELWVRGMQKALHDWEPMNVILVDYSEAFSSKFDYAQAVASTPEAASQIVNFIKTTLGRKRPNLHFIGYSLGTHIAGQAARLLKQSGIIVDRITALDPANPCFKRSSEKRLKKSDAKLVDVIHTNSEVGENGNFGIYRSVGDIDFYVNGGNDQAKCQRQGVTYFTNILNKANDIAELILETGVDVLEVIEEYFDYDYYEDEDEDEDDDGEDLDEIDYDEVISDDSHMEKTLSRVVAGWTEFLVRKVTGVKNANAIVENIVLNDHNIICNHGESPEYFILSLKKKKLLWGNPEPLPMKVTKRLKCKNKGCRPGDGICVEMGMNVTAYTTKEKTFYVDPNPHKPSCADLRN